MRIDIISGSSADLWILEPLLWAAANQDVNVRLIILGAHFLEHSDLGRIGSKSILDNALILRPNSQEQLTSQNLLSDTYTSLMNLYAKDPPGRVVYLGDRLEILGAAIACHVLGIPSFHLHGGEVTAGSLDDSQRHAISKLSNAHICFSLPAAKRLERMGEDPNSIFISDSLVLDRIERIRVERRETPDSKPLLRPYCVVTIHPVTNNQEETKQLCKVVFGVLKEQSNLDVFITGPNSDQGRETIVTEIVETLEESPEKFRWIQHFGGDEFLKKIGDAKFVIGNSSSGILEAPLLNTTSINVGTRQTGRDQEASVISVEPEFALVRSAIERALAQNVENSALLNAPLVSSGLRVLEFVMSHEPNKVKYFHD